MKLSTVLLSSAALLVAGAAYAADLPAKKAAPAAAPTGCAALGAGYIAVPGGDTCIKISGYVRSDDTYSSNVTRPTTSSTAFAGDYGFQVDAAQNSEMGTIKSTIFLENNTTSAANVSFAGLTAGKFDDIFDIGGGYNYSGNAYGPNSSGLNYSTSVGASTVTLAAIAANNNNTASTGVASRPDLQAKFATAMGAFSVTAGLASHEVAATTGSAQGYAFIGQAKFDAGVAKIMGYVAYAQGASKYLTTSSTQTLTDSASDASNLSSGTTYEGEIDVPLGKNDTVGIFGESLSITQGSSSYARTQYAAAFTHTIAKGLFVRPEIYTETINGTTGNGAYLRIERDF